MYVSLHSIHTQGRFSAKVGTVYTQQPVADDIHGNPLANEVLELLNKNRGGRLIKVYLEQGPEAADDLIRKEIPKFLYSPTGLRYIQQKLNVLLFIHPQATKD